VWLSHAIWKPYVVIVWVWSLPSGTRSFTPVVPSTWSNILSENAGLKDRLKQVKEDSLSTTARMGAMERQMRQLMAMIGTTNTSRQQQASKTHTTTTTRQTESSDHDTYQVVHAESRQQQPNPAPDPIPTKSTHPTEPTHDDTTEPTHPGPTEPSHDPSPNNPTQEEAITESKRKRDSPQIAPQKRNPYYPTYSSSKYLGDDSNDSMQSSTASTPLPLTQEFTTHRTDTARSKGSGTSPC
jgi:hypothetical protein